MSTWGWAPYIICPHCGEADHELSDYPRGLNLDGDTVETSCSYCDKPIKVTVSVTYEFHAEVPPDPKREE